MKLAYTKPISSQWKWKSLEFSVSMSVSMFFSVGGQFCFPCSSIKNNNNEEEDDDTNRIDEWRGSSNIHAKNLMSSSWQRRSAIKNNK